MNGAVVKISRPTWVIILLFTFLQTPGLSKPLQREDELSRGVKELLSVPEPVRHDWVSSLWSRQKVARAEQLQEELQRRFPGPPEWLVLPAGTRGLDDETRERLWADVSKVGPNFWKASTEAFLPHRPEVFDRVLSMRAINGTLPPSDWAAINDPRQHALLLRLAKEGRPAPLMALTMSDWEAAEPLVRGHLAGSSHLAALMALFVRPSTRSEAVVGLLETVRDEDEDQTDRKKALETLLASPWSGRAELLEACLVSPSDMSVLTDAMKTVAARDPDFFTSLLLPALDDPRQIVRARAAVGLISVGTADSLRPIVPWLGDIRWKGLWVGERDEFVRRVVNAGVAEAIPALTAIAFKDTGPYSDDRTFAAAAIALRGHHRKEVRARLEERLAKAEAAGKDRYSSYYNEAQLLEAGLAGGLFTVVEQVEALETLALALKDARDPWELRRQPYSRPEALAEVLIERVPGDAVLAGFVARIQELREEGAVEARYLENVITFVNCPFVDTYLLDRLSDENCDGRLLTAILDRLKTLRSNPPSRARLLRLSKVGGFRQGLACAILGDRDRLHRTLAYGDVNAAEALLAGARYLDLDLDVAAIGDRVKRDPHLRGAAVAYLDQVESQPARDLTRHLQPDGRIIGLESQDCDFRETESQAVALLRGPEPPDEIYALILARAPWFNETPGAIYGRVEVRVYQGRAELHILGRPSQALELEEFADFRDDLKDIAADALPRFTPKLYSARHVPPAPVAAEYLHITPAEGTRVVFLPAQIRDGQLGERSAPHDRLYQAFWDLAERYAVHSDSL